MMGLALILAAAIGWWGWKTGRLRAPRAGDVAAVVAVLVAVRLFSRGEAVTAVAAIGGACWWAWFRTRGILRAPADRGMTPERARALLDVPRGASVSEIRAAHRRIMQRVHPDVGGSTQLAVEINAARDRLLATHVKR